mmetsp:Transcript_43362/g.50791  ORF Transcript_43362/g.50791 Transcript_43362/m.50791 type:complete len:271 (-) Transcript_43362:142-954(-)
MLSSISYFGVSLLAILLHKSTHCSAAEDTVFVQFNVQLSPGWDPTSFMLEVNPSWAPIGAERFLDLVDNHPEFWSGVRFFRVIEGFMAQFGIAGDPVVAAEWKQKKIVDDEVKASNLRGYISYATSGEDTRRTQMFINLDDNKNLDSQGFSPFGKVVDDDMDIVDQIYSGYGEGAPKGDGPSQRLIQNEGNVYLEQEFPNLSYIISVKRVPKDVMDDVTKGVTNNVETLDEVRTISKGESTRLGISWASSSSSFGGPVYSIFLVLFIIRK